MDTIAALDDGVPLHSTTFRRFAPDKFPQVEGAREHALEVLTHGPQQRLRKSTTKRKRPSSLP
ncbi:hypothetical protein MMC22_010460 [Lobaria immixta]|nr:hypothetical protein [Lobaria immixta]